MKRREILIPKEIIDVSKVDVETHTCSDGAPVWVDLNMGGYKGPNGETTLELEKKAEYVNKRLIRKMWYRVLESQPQLKDNDYAKAISYFLTN